jgi:hypothetical protein
MNIYVIIIGILLIIYFFNNNNIIKENMNFKEDMIFNNKEENIMNNNCMENIKRYKLIKKDLENLIYKFKICSLSDSDYVNIMPFKNDCESSPSNKKWMTNLNVQRCVLKTDNNIKNIKKKFNLTDEEYNIIKQWKKLKCLNNLPLKFSEVEYAKNFNCINNCKYKKYVCKNIIKDVKNKINIYNVCSCLKEKECNNQPSKHKYNDNVNKNIKIQKCRNKINNWLLEKYKYWDLKEDDRIRILLNHWENVDSSTDFLNNLDDDKCKLLTRCN